MRCAERKHGNFDIVIKFVLVNLINSDIENRIPGLYSCIYTATRLRDPDLKSTTDLVKSNIAYDGDPGVTLSIYTADHCCEWFVA